ncbi:MAG: DUF11 domain-containing protein [Firmicutes bacterium]|nr:DUF11 domain-containing protein [Bacillota bacterium]
MATLENTSFLDLDLCEEAISVESNEVVTTVIDLSIVKEASCAYVILGKNICYTVTVTNNSDVELLDVMFRDPLPSGLVYVEGSLEVDGTPVEPATTSPDLTYLLESVPAGGEPVVITFCATAVGNTEA